MTLTGIGYGEMLPRSTAERVICTFCMMASGVVWTYAIGSVASIATTLSPNRVLYQNTMDQLNYFMKDRGLPRPLRMLLREYFSSARRVHQLNTDIGLLEKMSPLLQGNGACACTLALFDSPRLACTAHSPFASHATCPPSFFTSDPTRLTLSPHSNPPTAHSRAHREQEMVGSHLVLPRHRRDARRPRVHRRSGERPRATGIHRE